jgi:hypothetical protein
LKLEELAVPPLDAETLALQWAWLVPVKEALASLLEALLAKAKLVTLGQQE